MESSANTSEQRKGKLFEVKIDGENEKYNVRAANYTELEKNVRLKIKIPKTKNIKIMFEDLVICDDEDLDNVKEMEKGNKLSLKVKFCQQDNVRDSADSGYSCNEGTTFFNPGSVHVASGQKQYTVGFIQGNIKQCNIGTMHGRNYGKAVGKANCQTLDFESNFKQTPTFNNVGAMTVTAGEQGTAMGFVQGNVDYSPTHVIGKGDGVTAAKIQGEVQQEK